MPSLSMLIIAMVSMFSLVDSSCFMDLPKITMDPNLGAIVRDCQYNNHTIPKGTHWRDYDTCFDCNCDKDGMLSCCGFSYNAGVMMVEGCKMKILEHCEFMWVDESDDTKPCPLTAFG